MPDKSIIQAPATRFDGCRFGGGGGVLPKRSVSSNNGVALLGLGRGVLLDAAVLRLESGRGDSGSAIGNGQHTGGRARDGHRVAAYIDAASGGGAATCDIAVGCYCC